MEHRLELQTQMELEEKLRDPWHDLLQKYTTDISLIEELYSEITGHYTALGRHYHTLSHLSNLLHLLYEYRSKLLDSESVEFAIWYHDLIYEPTQPHSEARSADIAAQRLQRLSFPPERIQKVKSMIASSFRHHLHPGADDVDGRFFLDFDLAILGADRQVYVDYLQEIRQEYIKIPLSDYTRGRKVVLQRFLEKEAIYFTAEFQERFEEQARDNIQFEMNLLGE
jgi:predicted metal-dependent HD superfamily phosphohydrolase